MAVVATSPNSAKGRLPGERGSGLRAAAAQGGQRQQVEELETNFGKLKEVVDDDGVFAGERRSALHAAGSRGRAWQCSIPAKALRCARVDTGSPRLSSSAPAPVRAPVTISADDRPQDHLDLAALIGDDEGAVASRSPNRWRGGFVRSNAQHVFDWAGCRPGSPGRRGTCDMATAPTLLPSWMIFLIARSNCVRANVAMR